MFKSAEGTAHLAFIPLISVFGALTWRCGGPAEPGKIRVLMHVLIRSHNMAVVSHSRGMCRNCSCVDDFVHLDS